MTRLAVAGAAGRMGQRILQLASDDDRFNIVAALGEKIDPQLGKPVLGSRSQVVLTTALEVDCDAYIDFSLPAGTMQGIKACRAQGVPMVIGTTGHNESELKAITDAAKAIPIVKASNFSIGINLLLGMVGKVARQLGENFDIELVETHHRNKVDAPSGTALSLLDEVLASTGRTREGDVVFGRQGHTGVRPKGQIAVHTIRMGDVVGEHSVHYSGPGETITLTHTALSRDAFAQGALTAAAWIAGKSPGLYSMLDVLDS